MTNVWKYLDWQLSRVPPGIFWNWGFQKEIDRNHLSARYEDDAGLTWVCSWELYKLSGFILLFSPDFQERMEKPKAIAPTFFNASSDTAARNAAVLLSGGIDSAACAYLLKTQGFNVRGIFIDYGQASRIQEQVAVAQLGNTLGIEVITLEASSGEAFATGELIGRNAFLIISAIFLGKVHSGLLATGLHSGTCYYDCSVGFFHRMNQIAQEHTNGRLILSAPFLTWSKQSIYSYFLESGLPINETYSCESGGVPPCEACPSCLERRTLEC